jgi:hypothetical protein
LLKPPDLETTMLLDHPTDGLAAIRTHIGAIFVSLELSRSNWLVTSLSSGPTGGRIPCQARHPPLGRQLRIRPVGRITDVRAKGAKSC